MTKSRPLVSIGFIYYSTEGYPSRKYLSFFLESLLAQTYEHVEIICVDNGTTDGSISILEEHPKVRVCTSENIGMAANNLILQEAKGEYIWFTNVDMVFSPNILEELVMTAERMPDGGSFGCVLGKWDFDTNKKSEQIDTAGISMDRAHHAREMLVGKTFDADLFPSSTPYPVFGISGANILLRRSAIHDIAKNNELVDPAFFMYKEDIDIAYRLLWSGWKNYMIPKMLGWHDRTLNESKHASQKHLRMWKNRSTKSTVNRTLSIRNHLFMLHKNFSGQYSIPILLKTLFEETGKFIFVLIFETSALGAYVDFFKRKTTLQKVHKKCSPKDIEPYLQ